MDRREWILGAAGAASSAVLGAADAEFSFIHLTDTHIQPELRAGEGCRQCFARVNHLKPDFVISGGDLVFDAAETGPERAKLVYDLYATEVKRIACPVHTVIGNHDVFGVGPATGVRANDAMYGKRMFEDRIGKRYAHFQHNGWHFVTLDSIHLTHDHSFIGRIDDDQLTWLANELKSIPKQAPLVVATHIPLATGFLQYATSPAKPDMLIVTNARELLELLWPHNLKAVLQGHTHIRETVLYNGCQFITSGAVCGNWWKGLRLGHPEGFGVLTARNGELTWRYETYGFKADSA